MPDLLSFITRHVVNVFGFKCPSAVFAGSYLTAAAISEPPPPFFFLTTAVSLMR